MNIATVILIIIGIVGLIIIWKFLKPYIIKYDNTILFTGGLGAGKTYSSVKMIVILIRKMRTKIKFYNKYTRRIKNAIIKLQNNNLKRFEKKFENRCLQYKRYKNWLTRNKDKYKNKTYKNYLDPKPIPQVYSNIPIHFKTSAFSTKREWAKKLKIEHITLIEEIEEYSVILIDELPQFINQFNWNIELVKHNINEFITFFRHYIGGYLLMTAQSEDEIVAQMRRKLNIAIWCFDMKFYFFKQIYSIRMCDILMSDNINNVSTTFIVDNTRKKWGFRLTKNTYDSRCYRERYKNILDKPKDLLHDKLTTNEIIKVEKIISPLDDGTTQLQKEKMKEDILKIQNKKVENDKRSSSSNN